METHQYRYTFKVTPERAGCYFVMEVMGTDVEDAKRKCREDFKIDHPQYKKFRVTQIKDWRVGCSMYD